MENFMEIYDPATGKRTRRRLVHSSTMHQGGPHPYQNGKSREQGAHGVTRGGDGWSALYRPSAPTMALGDNEGTTRAAPITAKVTSQKGFNQILGAIAARNNAKLQSINNSVIADLHKAAMMRQAQENAARMRLAAQLGIAKINDASKRRAQAIDEKLGMKRLELEKRRQDIMSGYYSGQLANRGEANRIQQQKLWLEARPKERDPLDAAIQRKKIVPDAESFSYMLPDAIRSEISDANKERAYGYYLKTGKIPQFRQIDSTFDVDYEPINETAPQHATPQIHSDHIKALGEEIAKAYGIPPTQLKIDYDRGGFISPKNPQRIIPFDAAYRLVFGAER